MKAFPKLWEKGNWERITYVIADKAYDCGDVRRLLQETGEIPVIPNREKGALYPGVRDKERYKTRSSIGALLRKNQRQ